MHTNIDADFATSFLQSAACLFNLQRTHFAMKHASEACNVCVKVPSLTLPPVRLSMTPATADNTKKILEYSVHKEQLRFEIVASALASAKNSGDGLMLEVDDRCSNNTNVNKIEAMDMKVRVSSSTSVLCMKWWVSLGMVPWPYDGKGHKIETATDTYDENENEEEETKALAYSGDTIATPYDYKMNNNIGPSQGKQNAPKKPKREAKTITNRSAGNATPSPSFFAVILGALVSIFCLLPSSHSESENEMMPSARPVPGPHRRFQQLPFNSERTKPVWKRPQPSNPQQPFTIDTEKAVWPHNKGKDPACIPPVSEWIPITPGRESKGPVPPHPGRTSALKIRRATDSEASQLSKQPDDSADQIQKSIPFESRDKGPAPSSPLPERTSPKNAHAYRLSKILGQSFSTGRVPVEMIKKRTEKLLQDDYPLRWRQGLKAEIPSRVSPTKRDTEGLWLDWDEESRPIPKHGSPAMCCGLESTTVTPSDVARVSKELPPEADTEGLWLDWNEPEPEPVCRNRAPAIFNTSELTRMPSPEADVVDSGLNQKVPSALEHITPLTSLESGLNLEIMPDSYADISNDASMDTPLPEFTPVFGSLITPPQQLQVIAPQPSPPHRSFYSRFNAQLHRRDVVALRSYPQEGDEYIPYSLERYIFTQIRPPFLHDHNNIVGPRVLAQTRPRGEVQMRRIEPTDSREYEGRVPSIKSMTFDEMNLGQFDDFESSDVEDESYADDLSESQGRGKLSKEWFYRAASRL